jgi:putative ABC transport system substrate-binding protein
MKSGLFLTQLRHRLDIAVGHPMAGFRPYQALIRADRMPCPQLGASMRRREFIGLVGGVAALPLAARAQQSGKMKRIAMVHPAEKVGNMTIINSRQGFRAFFEELNRLGYVEGQNLVVERYSAEGRIDYFSQLARDVVNTHPDVIFVQSNLLVLAFKAATASIPMVVTAGDPVPAGIVSSIAHPGGNITGVAVDAGVELLGKRLGLLVEAIPKPLNAKYLASQGNWKGAAGRVVQDAGKHLGITVSGALLDGTIDETQYRSVFAAMEQDGVDALMVSPELVNLSNDQLLVDLAAKSRIPTIYAYRETVALGGLMAYAPDYADTLRRAANAVGQILKGANPGDIPFYQATKFELVINVKTARELGLEIPSSLLLRADEVIE